MDIIIQTNKQTKKLIKTEGYTHIKKKLPIYIIKVRHFSPYILSFKKHILLSLLSLRFFLAIKTKRSFVDRNRRQCFSKKIIYRMV